MADVIAKSKGYFGGVIREVGDRFTVPDEIWNDKKRRPSWAAPAKFGGKGDHDGDGEVGGTVPSASAGNATIQVPADWQNLKAAEKKELAKAITGENMPNAKAAEEAIEAHLEANKPEAFGDAPEPQQVQGNGVQEALGGNPPDWVAPGHIVQADD